MKVSGAKELEVAPVPLRKLSGSEKCWCGLTLEDGLACRQYGVEGCQSGGEVFEERRELGWWVAEVGVGIHTRQRKQRVLELVPGVLVLPFLIVPRNPVGGSRDYAPGHAMRGSWAMMEMRV